MSFNRNLGDWKWKKMNQFNFRIQISWGGQWIKIACLGLDRFHSPAEMSCSKINHCKEKNKEIKDSFC